jgi:cell division septation protein DedD
MRDIERLQDVVEYRVNSGQLRLVFLGVLAVSCAIFAVGVTVGRRISPQPAALAADPLAELDRAIDTTPARGAVDGVAAPPLTYHDELTQTEDRPAEHTPEGNLGDEDPGLDQRDGPVGGEHPARHAATPGSGAGEAEAGRGGEPRAPAAPPVPEDQERVPTEPAIPEQLQPGEASIFTLQVGSFETREEADEFAAELRTRGHRVFLVQTGTPDRGTWYRVRVGPFTSRRDAVLYQSRFEREERLPTFLVQRRTR